MTIPASFANLGWKTYIYYAVFNAVFVPIIYFFLVETRQRSLEELDVVFATPGDPVKNEKRLPKDISIETAKATLGLSYDNHSGNDSEEFVPADVVVHEEKRMS